MSNIGSDQFNLLEWLFPASVQEAKESQKEMALRVLKEDRFERSSYMSRIPSFEKSKKSKTFPNKASYARGLFIAGMDVSNNPFDPKQRVFASVVVLSYPQLKIVETATVMEKQTFPYIPGLLGFREAPALVHAFQKLLIRPDVIMVDGHGISHPRGLGIASHLGVLLDIPTIGVAKSILVGSMDKPLSEEVGSQAPLIWKEECIGVLLKTKKRAHPLVISIGHKVTLETAIQLVKSSLSGYRLPEPTRQAHLAANASRTLVSV